jgi:hypothetical protein
MRSTADIEMSAMQDVSLTHSQSMCAGSRVRVTLLHSVALGQKQGKRLASCFNALLLRKKKKIGPIFLCTLCITESTFKQYYTSGPSSVYPGH